MRLRSLLFVPGDRPDRMEKALGAGADALILDLEDAVAPDAKPAAREAACSAAASGEYGRRTLTIRANGIGTEWHDDDLAAAAEAGPAAVVVPKEGATLTSDAVLEHTRSLLAGFKTPKYVVVADALPKNPSGKILKRELRERYAS